MIDNILFLNRIYTPTIPKEPDRDLFLSAIQTVMDIIARTGDVTLITDGERRYSLLLFEVCQELFRSGRPGRPRKVLRRGVRVRLKNKGSPSHRRGRKRPKYETPCPEHPETPQNLSNGDIHANHVEAFNAALRRRNSAYRRKTNTYSSPIPVVEFLNTNLLFQN